MKKLLIAASLFLPAAAFAQSSDAVGAEAQSQINTAVRADVAARPITASDAPATVGNVRVRTARVGQKTVTLQNGGLPSAEAKVQANKPGA